MQSTGSTSSQPSLDSLSSSDSFLFSDTDDSTDVFLLEGEVATRGGRGAFGARGVYGLGGGSMDSPGSQWACDGFTDPERSEATAGHTASVSSTLSSSSGSWSGTDSGRGSEKMAETEGDVVFAQKCFELRGYVRPLLELLNGLKKGRFDKGLSSFQQSVAMDRIQRIVGVLQKPHIGEKYLPTLLQVEMMLKLWFPQVRPVVPSVSEPAELSRRNVQSHNGGQSGNSTPLHKHKDQRHIPVKKRRHSWSDADCCASPPPVAAKRLQVIGQGETGQKAKDDNGSPMAESDLHKKEGEPLGQKSTCWSEPSLTWVHVSPIFSPPKSRLPHESYVLLAVPPPTSRGSPATQDSSISSTTPFGEPMGCQSQPVAMETTKSSNGQSPPVTSRPLSGAEPGSVRSTLQT